MPSYCLNTRENSLLSLNMTEYAGIYLKKQSVEYAIILNLPDHSIRSVYKLLSSYLGRDVLRTLSNI